MSCVNYCLDCSDCPLASPSTKIYQEVHVTADGGDMFFFGDVVERHGGKLITIDLGEGVPSQSMSSITIEGSNQDGVALAKQIEEECRDKVSIERLKVESSIFHEFEGVAGGYYEGHLSVATSASETLRQVTLPLGGHTSRNAFKTGLWMVTYRDYTTKENFQSRMAEIEAAVSANFLVRKRIEEYCHYDTNSAVDHQWLKVSA